MGQALAQRFLFSRDIPGGVAGVTAFVAGYLCCPPYAQTGFASGALVFHFCCVAGSICRRHHCQFEDRGGANLHNMDAYFTLLLIVLSYLVFARYGTESGETAQPIAIPWLVVVLLLLMPVWAYPQFDLGITTYDPVRTQSVLTDLQEHVDEVNRQGGEILFITQRHLISMHMLKGVTLVPEYEREDLMEMAMGDNIQYLGQFREDMQEQRFALIVVDPLNYKFLANDRSFAEENNVWVKRVMKHILCNYREEAIYPEDEIALYVLKPARGNVRDHFSRMTSNRVANIAGK